MPIQTSRILGANGRPLSCGNTDEANVTKGQYVNTKSLATAATGTNYINLGDSLAFDRYTPFSFYMRWKQAAPHATYYARYVGRFVVTNAVGWTINGSPASAGANAGKLSFWMCSSYSASSYLNIVADQAVADGTWHHILLTYDGSGLNTGPKIYIDGALPTQLRGGTLSADSLQATYGRLFSETTTESAICRINEAATWNRELTAAEVIEAYNGGTTHDLRKLNSGNDLANYWWCGDGDDYSTTPGSRIYDHVGGAHGYIAGSVSIVTDS